MSFFRRNAAATWLLVVLSTYAGCGEKNNNVTVTGSVVRNGQPIPLSRNGYIQVTLHPDLPPDAPFTPKFAECDKPTGKFEIRDVPVGKYKVGVQQFDPDPTSDKLNGAYRAETG